MSKFSHKGVRVGVPGLGGALPFDQQVLVTQPSSLLAYWPLEELTGSTADNAEGTAARDGTYTSVTLADTTFLDGKPAPLFPGSPAGRVNVYSDSLRSAMDFDEGTLMVAYKPQAGSVWSDSTMRRLLSFLTDATAARLLFEVSGNYGLLCYRIASGTLSIPRYTNLTRWIVIFMTYSRTGDELNFVVNGATIGTLTTLAAATGQLNSTYATIGAYTNSGVNPSKGWLGRAAVWSTPLSDAEMAAIYNTVKPSGTGFFVIGDSKSSYNNISGIWVDTLAENLTVATGSTWLESPDKIAIGGYDVGEMDTYLQANLSSVSGSPSVILISMGANDIPQPTPQVDFEAQLTSIITQLNTKFPNAPIYVSRPYRSDYDANSFTIAGYVNNVIAATVANAGHDETDWFKTGIATYSADGVHYNAAGALEAANQWQTILGY